MSISKNGTGAADFFHELHKLLLAVVVQVCSCVIETEVCAHSEFCADFFLMPPFQQARIPEFFLK